MKKALVVLSGGQDSVTCLFRAVQSLGRENVHALTVDYAQRHRIEVEAALRASGLADLPEGHHEVVFVPTGTLAGTSPLTNTTEVLEQYENATQMAEVIGDRVEKTFVPMRNPFFLTMAANRAAVLGAREIWTGVCQEDNANYPDCTSTFIEVMEDMINEALGTDVASVIRIVTPLMSLTKDETVELAWDTPGAYGALAYSHTSYDGQFPPIGRDHATILRADGFERANTPDPLVLRAHRLGRMPLPVTPNYAKPEIEEAMRHIYKDLDGKWDRLPDAAEWL